MEKRLDLNEHLIQHPAATFFVRVDGDSMCGAGIHPGDLLIVDRSLDAVSGTIVVALIDGEADYAWLARLPLAVGQSPTDCELELTRAIEAQRRLFSRR